MYVGGPLIGQVIGDAPHEPIGIYVGHYVIYIIIQSCVGIYVGHYLIYIIIQSCVAHP